VDIIPRLLFRKDALKVESSVSIRDEISHTATYLNSCGEYAYITGLLTYEDLSLVYDAHQDMMVYKRQKKEAHEEEAKTKQTLVSLREGTETTKDNTFTSAAMKQDKVKRDTLSSVAEEEMASSSRENTITSQIEKMNAPINITLSEDSDSEEEEGHNSEEDRKIDAMNVLTPSKSESLPKGVHPKKKDSLTHIKAYRKSLKKSESTQDEKVPRKKIKLPKLIVLVSKYPIYKDMTEFLRKIKSMCSEYTKTPIEYMITNLIYEFPHPSDKYIVRSEFWRAREKYKFEYETYDSLPY
jgi:hypothetical protein